MTMANEPNAYGNQTDDTDEDEDDDYTRTIDNDSVTRCEVGIEYQLLGKPPHEGVFVMLRALYQHHDFAQLLAKKGQHVVALDPTCRMVLKNNLFKVSRTDIDAQGKTSAAGSNKQFSIEEYSERYKNKKLSENFREFGETNNRLKLELSRITMIDLMKLFKKECLEVLHHLTEAQAKQLVHPHLYKLYILLSKCKEQPIPFYSDPS
ncbi:MAG: hypothetical protein HW380_327 [Magnetococcales bacterium]|nr:hypothetical protein [Magnetococcales bacterium]